MEGRQVFFNGNQSATKGFRFVIVIRTEIGLEEVRKRMELGKE